MVRNLGLATATAIAAVMLVSPAAAQKAPKLTKEVQQLLAKAQEAQKAGDNATAMQLLDQAEPAAKTDDDRYMVSVMRLNSGLATKDNAVIEKALQGALASGKVPAEEAPKFYRNLGALALQRNDFAAATGYFEKLMQLNPNDTSIMIDVAELQRRQNQPQKAIQTIQNAIATQEKATSQKADEQWYRRALAIAYDAKLPAETSSTGMALIKAYPSATNWRDVLTIYRESNKFDDQMNLDVMRLMRANGALAGERDYAEYAETASMRGYPGESKAVLDEGVSKGALQAGRPFVKELTASISPKLASDKSSLPGLEKEAAAAKNGRTALSTADAYLGYGNYAKAAELYKLALSKGGVDADTANLRLGFALGQTGDKSGAESAFKAIAAEPRKTLAQYWLIWLGNKA